MEADESTHYDEARVQELFDRLDLDKDGRIDIKDLSDALHQLGVPQVPGQAEVSTTSKKAWIHLYHVVVSRK